MDFTRVSYVIARILLGSVFAYMGFYKILNWENTAAWMAMKNIPFIPVLLLGAIVIELGGGLLLLAGIRIREIAIVLALFLIPTNLFIHNFWSVPEAMQQSEFLSFLQNIMIIGGLVAISALQNNKEFQTK